MNWNLLSLLYYTLKQICGFSNLVVIAPALAASGIGGFYGGAITGAATGFSASLTAGIVHGDEFGSSMSRSIGALFMGFAIGGVIGGIDAELKGQRFLDGKGKVLTKERQLLGHGNTPDENTHYTIDRLSEYNEVGSLRMDKDLEFSPKIPIGFEGDLTVKGISYPQQGETFYIESDGIEVFSSITRGEKINLKIPSSNKYIKWGIRNPNPGTTISNQLPTVGNILDEVVVKASRFDSYIRITGDHRAWAGFLFWGH